MKYTVRGLTNPRGMQDSGVYNRDVFWSVHNPVYRKSSKLWLYYLA